MCLATINLYAMHDFIHTPSFSMPVKYKLADRMSLLHRPEHKRDDFTAGVKRDCTHKACYG